MHEVPHQHHFVMIAVRASADGGRKCKPKRLTAAAGERIKMTSIIRRVGVSVAG